MRERPTAPLRLDTSVPALLVRVGHYPLHAGTLGVIRSLGRLGVAVHAVTEDGWTPAAVSRHLAGRLVWPAHERSDPQRLVARLRAAAAALGRAVAVATDDEAALLLAEHADELGEHLLLPRVAPGLPRRLASKRGLFELCTAHGIPTPHTVFPTSVDDLAGLAPTLTFPVVLKNVDPWTRLRAPVVASTTIVGTERELRDRLAARQDLTGVLLQEYIPHEVAEDWFVHTYCDADADVAVGFVGRKAYAWPPGRGVTADGRAAHNPVLAELTARLCRAVGYRGVNDLDWRLDRRDGRFKLVDFNPRVGAQFRFGQTVGGVDVVRALHLGMTGRPVPTDGQDLTRRVLVESIYLPARAGHRMSRLPAIAGPPRTTRTRGAWAEGSWRDPLPLAVLAVRLLTVAAAAGFRALLGSVRTHRTRTHRTRTHGTRTHPTRTRRPRGDGGQQRTETTEVCQ